MNILQVRMLSLRLHAHSQVSQTFNKIVQFRQITGKKRKKDMIVKSF